MIYNIVQTGVFISRPNRFVALVDIGGAETRCHVKNTGRLGELLVPGTRAIVQKSDIIGRKTAYDLIAVKNHRGVFNIDSSAPNKIFAEWMHSENSPIAPAEIKAEYVYGASRLDFMVTDIHGRRHLIETKGVTLLSADGDTALFPDAPTARGVKHVHHLIRALDDGYKSHIVFVVKTDCPKNFTPNRKNDPEFADALLLARERGVDILALRCSVAEDRITPATLIPVTL